MGQLLRVATFNANSIRSRLDQILAWLGAQTPDVLCIQETKVQDPDFPAQAIQATGYHVVFRGQKAHAGVALIAREPPQEVCYGLDDGGEPDEPRLIQATVRGIPIVNTYVPQGREVESPHFAYKLAWFARLRAYFERHYAPDAPLIWVGDLNVAPEEIDIHDPKGNRNHVDFHPDARAALREAMAWGFVDVFRRHHLDEPGQYSYYDYRVPNAVERGVGWRVDHVLAT
ncbi:MAG: exodeoxyribonuclease III, partial [Chloroflexota bacterium]